jgi:hypothetical protein
MVVSEGTNQPFEERCTYYRFSHGTEVEVLDMEYNQRVQTHDPNQIQMHVQQHPFHPPGLWRMSKIYSATGQHDAAAMFLRRCVYVYECGFHTSFLKHAREGTARMDCELRDEESSFSVESGGDGGRCSTANRIFFQSLHDHALMAARRGCRRSSLEVMKLLYQLDSRDPMGILASYDRRCLKAGEIVHVMNIFESGPEEVKRLPNWSFS